MNTVFLSLTTKGVPQGAIPQVAIGGAWLPGMGFVAGALVQALPEPHGLSFTLRDEYGGKYSELSRRTDGLNGKLIQVYFSHNAKNYGERISTSGKYLLHGGLAIGDPLIAVYTYGLIRARKAPAGVGVVGRAESAGGKAVPVVSLFGGWLADAGFVPDALATASMGPGLITIALRDNGMGSYSALVRRARAGEFKLFQVGRHHKRAGQPHIVIRGAHLDGSGFGPGDLYCVSHGPGLVTLRGLALGDLGF